MDVPPELTANRHWRTAVWSLRIGFAGLALVIVGVVLVPSGSTSVVLAAGVAVWLVGAAITVANVYRAHGDLPEPRPGWWSLRFQLLHDAFRAG